MNLQSCGLLSWRSPSWAKAQVYIKMKTRLKEYQKKHEELQYEFIRLITENNGRLALKFVNDISKLNEEYEDVFNKEKK